jgi:hypothetical protein
MAVARALTIPSRLPITAEKPCRCVEVTVAVTQYSALSPPTAGVVVFAAIRTLFPLVDVVVKPLSLA